MGRRRHPQETPGEPATPRLTPASLLFIGLVIGLSLGLYYAWMVDPVIFVDASPARLRQDYKEEYLFLISQSYAQNGRWPQAQARLQALDDANLPQTLNTLLEKYLREQRPAEVIKNMANLAQQAGTTGAVVALFAPTLVGGPLPTATPTLPPAAAPTATPTLMPTSTPPPTLTPTPTLTPSPTPQPDYRLLSQEQVCGAPLPRIEVIVYDALLDELPGVELLVSWEGGEDSFFTGFQPARGSGYGDFTMTAGFSYAVEVAAGSPVVSGLRVTTCTDGSQGGWRLAFQNLFLVRDGEED